MACVCNRRPTVFGCLNSLFSFSNKFHGKDTLNVNIVCYKCYTYGLLIKMRWQTCFLRDCNGQIERIKISPVCPLQAFAQANTCSEVCMKGSCQGRPRGLQARWGRMLADEHKENIGILGIMRPGGEKKTSYVLTGGEAMARREPCEVGRISYWWGGLGKM